MWSGTSCQEDTGSETRETRATCGSMESSRATSRSVEVRLVKLRSDSQHSRSSSIDEVAEEGQEVEHPEDNNTDPDWEENDEEEEDVKEDVGDDDPEYDPEKRDKTKKNT